MPTTPKLGPSYIIPKPDEAEMSFKTAKPSGGNIILGVPNFWVLDPSVNPDIGLAAGYLHGDSYSEDNFFAGVTGNASGDLFGSQIAVDPVNRNIAILAPGKPTEIRMFDDKMNELATYEDVVSITHAALYGDYLVYVSRDGSAPNVHLAVKDAQGNYQYSHTLAALGNVGSLAIENDQVSMVIKDSTGDTRVDVLRIEDDSLTREVSLDDASPFTMVDISGGSIFMGTENGRILSYREGQTTEIINHADFTLGSFINAFNQGESLLVSGHNEQGSPVMRLFNQAGTAGWEEAAIYPIDADPVDLGSSETGNPAAVTTEDGAVSVIDGSAIFVDGFESGDLSRWSNQTP